MLCVFYFATCLFSSLYMLVLMENFIVVEFVIRGMRMTDYL